MPVEIPSFTIFKTSVRQKTKGFNKRCQCVWASLWVAAFVGLSRRCCTVFNSFYNHEIGRCWVVTWVGKGWGAFCGIRVCRNNNRSSARIAYGQVWAHHCQGVIVKNENSPRMWTVWLMRWGSWERIVSRWLVIGSWFSPLSRSFAEILRIRSVPTWNWGWPWLMLRR